MADCRFAALCGCDLAVLYGYPSDLTAHFRGMPSVGGGGDMLEHRPVSDTGDTAVISAIAHAGIYSMCSYCL